MADTIHSLRQGDIDSRVALAIVQAENRVLKDELAAATDRLALIFDAISRGEQVDLAYPDGRVLTATRAKKRGEERAQENGGD